MTHTLGTNENNDIYLGADGNIVLLNGLAAVVAACETATKAQLGEMIFAVTSGIPNFQTVWVGNPNLAIFESYLRNVILGVEGVLAVSNVITQVTDGVLSYTATISSIYGSAEINGSV